VNRLGLVGRFDDRRHRPEHLLVIGWHARAHIGQHRRRVPGSRPIRHVTPQQQARALGDTLSHLIVDFIASLHALERPELRRLVARITHRVRRHDFDEGTLESLAHASLHDETLAGDAALPTIDHTGRGADASGLRDVGIFEHEIGVRAAEFEHAFLKHRAGGARHLLSSRYAAGERHGSNRRRLNEGTHVPARDEKSPEEMLRESCLADHALDGNSTAWHVARMLEHRRIAGHERGRSEAEHLPEREIPRHDGKDNANRIIRHEGFGAAEIHRFAGEVALGILGEVVAIESAFLDLGQALLPGLAHLGRHGLGELRLPAPQHRRGLPHEPGPMGEGRAPPLLEGLAGLLCDPKGFIPRVPLVSSPALPCGRIGGLEARPLVWGIGRLAALRLVTLGRAGMLIHDRGLLDPI
jgi:hypothetical protein